MSRTRIGDGVDHSASHLDAVLGPELGPTIDDDRPPPRAAIPEIAFPARVEPDRGFHPVVVRRVLETGRDRDLNDGQSRVASAAPAPARGDLADLKSAESVC